MTLRNVVPLTVNPRGISDALDGTTVFSGAMATLQNLIPDPSTARLWQCRPAAELLTNFSGSSGAFSSGFSSGFAINATGAFSSGFSSGFFTATSVLNAGFISALKVIGDIAYGMVASSLNSGHDQPFAFNLSSGLTLNISGITAANTPASPATSGEWVPPSMDLIGTKLIVTHPGFTGAGGVYFGWFDISDTSAITWDGGNLAGLISFTTPPSVVKNFNGRAYYAVNPLVGQPSLVYSDVLDPLTATNANQVLTFDDNVPLTALAGLALSNQLGGIIQALLVFKSVQNIFQVTGDAASLTSPLAKNALNVATGTLSPNAVAPTSKGIMFIAPDGLRLIDFNAIVSDPIGVDGSGKTMPFIYQLIPSRAAAAANGTVYRVTVQDASLNDSPHVEYWYDIPRQVWSGPHTFPASLISPYLDTFVVAPLEIEATLFQSDYVQTSDSTFEENGEQLMFTYSTIMLPDTNQMSENNILESTIYMALVPAATYAISAANQNGQVIDSVAIVGEGSPTLWGQFQWGQALWGGLANPLYPRQMEWTRPIVFRRLQINVTGPSGKEFRIGTLHMRYEQLGYLQQPANAA